MTSPLGRRRDWVTFMVSRSVPSVAFRRSLLELLLSLTLSLRTVSLKELPKPMFVLAVLFGSLIVFRLLGFLGVSLFQTWHESMVYALAAMFCFTAVSHFGPLRRDLERMVPPWVPSPGAAVWVTGILEILGAIGLIVPMTRTLAGVCLILFLVAVFPANIYAAKTGATLGARPVTPLGVRGPMQLLFILLIFWAISE